MGQSAERWDFLTLLPECNNIDMYKDVGMIPYTLSHDFGLKTAVASSNMDGNAAGQLDMNNVRMDIIKLRKGNRFLAGLLFLLKNAKKIDVLNLYHGGKVVIVWEKLYKLLNRKGKVYLKLDMDFRYCDKLDTDLRYRKSFKKCTESADLVSAESECIRNRIQKYTEKKVQIIYNGYYNVNIKPPDAKKKENIFLTVGRLGTYQKATDVLLEAFAKSAHQHDWKLVLVGGVEEEFREYINRFFNKYPNLKERIEFTGIIADKQELIKYYDMSKVFVLPSRWESFGIVVVEALSRGCRVILTEDVAPHREFTCDGKFGDAIIKDDTEVLSDTMIKIAERKYDENTYDEIIKYAGSIFGWSVIGRRILSAIG